MSRSIRATLAITLFAWAGLAVTGCHEQEAQLALPERPPAPVMAVAAVAQDVPIYLEEIGRALAIESVTIQPQVTGKVISVHFTDGATVKKGDLLYKIDSRPFEAELAQAQAAIAQAKADLDWAKSDFTRFQEVQASGAVSKTDIEQKRNAVSVAEAKAQAAQAAFEKAKLDVEYCTITSPIDGRTGEHLVDVGNVVSDSGDGGGTKLLVLQRFDPIDIDFTVTEQELISVRQYMSAGALRTQVWIPGDEKNSRDGKLTFLDNAVQPGAGTVKLRGTLPNADGHFWPGQFVNVRLILATKKDAVLVPSTAQQIGQQGPYVYVVTDGEIENPTTKQKSRATVAEMRPITPGQRQGDRIVVESGVKAGERVITVGQNMVMPGGPVQVNAPPATQQAVAHGASEGEPKP